MNIQCREKGSERIFFFPFAQVCCLMSASNSSVGGLAGEAGTVGEIPGRRCHFRATGKRRWLLLGITVLLCTHTRTDTHTHTHIPFISFFLPFLHLLLSFVSCLLPYTARSMATLPPSHVTAGNTVRLYLITVVLLFVSCASAAHVHNTVFRVHRISHLHGSLSVLGVYMFVYSWLVT